MDSPVAQIDGFPRDGKYWRIAAIGELARSNAVWSEPRIALVLCPVPERSSWRSLHTAKDLRTVWINAGYLPYISVGTVWKNGAHVINVKNDDEIREAFDLNVTQGTTHILKGDHSRTVDGQRQYLIPPNQYPLGRDGLRSKFLGVDIPGVSSGLLIPMAEVFRFYYCNSSQLTKFLIWNLMRTDRNEVFNRDESYVLEDGSARLKLRKNIPDSDAWVISRFAFCSFAFSRAMQIGASCARERANRNAVVPDVLFPFEGTTRLTVRGRWIASWGAPRFLVYAIRRCTHPFPVAALHITSDRDNQSDGIFDPSRPQAFQNVVRAPAKSNGDWIVRLRSDTEPRKDILATTILLHTSRFADLDGKTVDRIPKENCQYRAAEAGLGPPVEGLSGYSSGEGDWRNNDAAPVRFHTVERKGKPLQASSRHHRPSFPQSLDAIRTVIKALEGLAGFRASYPGQPDGSRDFPVLRARSWSRIHGRARKALVAQLEYRTGYFYVFESERKGREQYSTLLTYRKNLSAFSDEHIEQILFQCVRNRGTWLKEGELPWCERKKLHHSWKFIDMFAARLAIEIRAAQATITGAPPPRRALSDRSFSDRGPGAEKGPEPLR